MKANLLGYSLVLILAGTACLTAYDPAPSMHHARMGHYSTTLSDGRVVVFGGHGTGFTALNTIEVYDPETNTWTVHTLPVPFDGGAAVKLDDGRYLLAGGAADLGIAPGYTNATLFNPSTGSIESTGAMTNPRMMCTGTQLTGGKVFITGGWYSPSSASVGDLWDPQTGTFTQTGSVTVSRALPLVVPMTDGRAIVTGGYPIYGGDYYTQVEIFDPTTLQYTLLRDQLFAEETGWVTAQNTMPIADCKLPDGRYYHLVYKTVDSVTSYSMALINPTTAEFTRLEIPTAALDGDSILNFRYNEGYFDLFVGKSINSAAQTRARLIRVPLEGGQIIYGSYNEVLSYYTGGCGMMKVGNNYLLTGGTTSIDWYYNFNPVTAALWIPIEGSAQEPHYNGWMWIQLPYAYSWTMQRWIYLWGDVYYTDLQTLETGVLVP